MAGVGVGVRPAGPDDRDHLLAVYASGRADELALVPWTAEELAAFIEQQAHAQVTAYRQQYPGDDFMVVTLDDEPVGRIFVGHLPTEVRIADIGLLPAWRGRGIGSRLITSLMDEARTRDLPLTLYVEEWNRARVLYTRLGFREVGGSGFHLRMEWRPDALAGDRSSPSPG